MATNTNANFRDYVYPLQAGVEETITVRGDYWQLVEAPQGPITIDFEQGVKIKRRAGSGGPAKYERVTLKSETTQTVRISLGNTDGRLPYDRTTLDGQDVNVAIIASGNVFENGDDVTVAPGATEVLVLANPNRISVRIGVPPDAFGFVRVGDATIGADRGAKLYPGIIEYMDGQQQFFVYNPTPESITVDVLEMIKE